MHHSTTRRSDLPRSRQAARVPTICVVDPQIGDYQDWKSLTKTKRLRVQFADTAEAALRIAQTTTVDAWVINAELPGLTGAELCTMLKSHDRPAPVLMVADCYSADLERAALAARATLFAVKPAHTQWLTHWLPAPSVPASRCSA